MTAGLRLVNVSKRCLCYLIAVLLPLVYVAVAEADILKPKLAAIPFVAKNIEAMGVTEYLTSVLLNELERGGFVEVIERRRLEGAMDLEGIRGHNISRPELQRLGARVGADYLVSGTVATNLNGMQLELAVLSVRTQQMVFADQLLLGEGDAPKLLRGLSDRIRLAFQGVNSAATGQVVMNKPLAPANSLEAVGSTNSIRLRWKHQEPERVVGYMLARGTSAEGPFSTVGTVIETTYIDENLRLNEIYYYRVTAIGQGGVTAEPSVVQRGGTSIAPAVPIFMNAEPLLAGALLSWRQRPGTVTDPRTEPKGVRVYRKLAGENEFLPLVRVPVGEGGTAVYRDHGLKDGETYLYLITSYNQAEAESEQSVQLSVQVPPLVSGFAAVSDKVRRIQLSWDQHGFSGTTGYRLLRSNAQDGQYQEIALLGDITKNSYLDGGLPDKTTYWYRIVPVSKERGTGGASREVSATTRDLPPTPTELTASRGEPRRVVLSWGFSSVSDDEVTGFYLYRTETGMENMTRLAELTADKRGYRDSDDTLKNGAGYDYAVASFNSSGAVSRLSSKVTATTKPLPARVSNLQLQDRATRLVSWKKSEQPDVVKYHIYRKGFLGWQKAATQTVTEWRSTETGRQELYVTAEDSDGLESEASDILVIE